MVIIETRNCRGLADRDKRVDILNKIRDEKISIACLQDVHLESWQKSTLRKEWNGHVELSAKTSASRGVAVLFSKNLEYSINKVEADSNGSFLIIDVSIIGLPRLTLVNIYAPNKDSPQFFYRSMG